MPKQNPTSRFDTIVVVLTLIVSGYIIYSRVIFFGGFKEPPATLLENVSAERSKIAVPLAATPKEERLRNIAFTHMAPKAKKVSIAGDFNDWVPQDLERDERGVWRVALKILPGHYAYNFIVDGRPYRDLYNPRTIDTGRGFMSSYIEVRPLESNAN